MRVLYHYTASTVANVCRGMCKIFDQKTHGNTGQEDEGTQGNTGQKGKGTQGSIGQEGEGTQDNTGQ